MGIQFFSTFPLHITCKTGDQRILNYIQVKKLPTCYLIISFLGVCRHCESVRKSQTVKESRTLSTHAPLSSASRPALIQEVRSVRSKLKDRETELLSIKRKLAAESVSVSDETEVSKAKLFLMIVCFPPCLY